MPARLAGSVAVVTLDPARSEAVAARLAAEGAGVIVVAHDADRGGRLAAAIGDSGAPTAVFCEGDDLEGELDALVELVVELGGRRP